MEVIDFHEFVPGCSEDCARRQKYAFKALKKVHKANESNKEQPHSPDHSNGQDTQSTAQKAVLRFAKLFQLNREDDEFIRQLGRRPQVNDEIAGIIHNSNRQADTIDDNFVGAKFCELHLIDTGQGVKPNCPTKNCRFNQIIRNLVVIVPISSEPIEPRETETTPRAS